MRFLVFNENRLGAIVAKDKGDTVVDITDLAPARDEHRGPLHRLIEAGADLSAIERAAHSRDGVPVTQVRLCAPLPRPGKIIGAPVNYRDHQMEMAMEHTIMELGVFLKAPSSILEPNGVVQLPYSDKRTDQEAELAVVIGRPASNVPAERALEYVFGYTCALDITVRSTEDRSTRKSFDSFTPIGPWVVTPEEVGDPGDITLKCWVNGELRQHANTSALLFSVAEVIAYTSSVMTLWPGDIISTGTPAGVGPLQHGYQVVVELSRIGRLEVKVSAERAVPYASRAVAGVRARAEAVSS